MKISSFCVVGVFVAALTGCRGGTATAPATAFGSLGAPAAGVQPAPALQLPTLGGTTRVTPPVSASLGTPAGVVAPAATLPASPGYLAPAPVGTFGTTPTAPAAAPIPPTGSFGSVDTSGYGSVPMGQAYRPQTTARVAPVGTGVQPAGYTTPSSPFVPRK